MIEWLKANAGKHVEALVIAVALVFGGRLYLQEHDARMQADAQVKAAQTAIDSLQKQQTAVQTQAAKEVVVLQERAASVQTAPQAVQALQSDPQVKAVLPDLAALPDSPNVSVNSLDLFKGANQCEQCAVNLAAEQKQLDLQKQIDVQKDTEIAALRKKPSFLHRFLGAAKVVGCSAAGGALGGLTKSAEGAAVGAATGAAVCQMF
ncbi:MAG TPA: hypothetical protein VFB43_17770 [Terracidiphilus sp.]|nr:hypothetical protein [Terracidiphilus sp.]